MLLPEPRGDVRRHAGSTASGDGGSSISDGCADADADADADAAGDGDADAGMEDEDQGMSARGEGERQHHQEQGREGRHGDQRHNHTRQQQRQQQQHHHQQHRRFFSPSRASCGLNNSSGSSTGSSSSQAPRRQPELRLQSPLRTAEQGSVGADSDSDNANANVSASAAFGNGRPHRGDCRSHRTPSSSSSHQQHLPVPVHQHRQGDPEGTNAEMRSVDGDTEDDVEGSPSPSDAGRGSRASRVGNGYSRGHDYSGDASTAEVLEAQVGTVHYLWLVLATQGRTVQRFVCVGLDLVNARISSFVCRFSFSSFPSLA